MSRICARQVCVLSKADLQPVISSREISLKIVSKSMLHFNPWSWHKNNNNKKLFEKKNLNPLKNQPWQDMSRLFKWEVPDRQWSTIRATKKAELPLRLPSPLNKQNCRFSAFWHVWRDPKQPLQASFERLVWLKVGVVLTEQTLLIVRS